MISFTGSTAAGLRVGELRAQRVASRLACGIAHINDQPVVHEVYGRIGGMGMSGNGARTGNLVWRDEYTVWKWITASPDIPHYPF